MTEIIRHCPDCGQDRPFQQHHGAAGWCSDTGDCRCPEWHCLVCGAVLLIGDIPTVPERIFSAGIRDRVA
jgi:hypothetical protein